MASIAFFPSLYGKAVPGLCFLSLSLISVKRRISYPVMMEQIDKAPTNNPPDVSKKKSPGKRGRPQGSKNRRRRAVELSPALRFVQETITRFLQLIGDHVKVIYFVYDGAFGNNDALQMVKQTGLHLMSKLRHDSALYFPYDGPYSGRGKRRKYGKKLDYQHLPAEYVQSSSLEDGMQTKIYQMKVWPTVRPFLRRFRRNSTKPCIESQREAQYLQKTLLEWAQSGEVSIGLLAPFDDDGQGDTLKRFEQAFGRRASRFAPGIPGLKSCPLCSLSRSLTAADTCQERQPPQGHRYQPEEPCGLVVSLHRHRCAGEGPPCEPPQAPLHLIGTARGQHRVRQ